MLYPGKDVAYCLTVFCIPLFNAFLSWQSATKMLPEWQHFLALATTQIFYFLHWNTTIFLYFRILSYTF